MILSKGMYVRCPADRESIENPRVFVCGQVCKVDKFARTILVAMHDPFNLTQFFEGTPTGIQKFPDSVVRRCSLFKGTHVIVDGKTCEVIAQKEFDDKEHLYYVQSIDDKETKLVSERDMIASFTNGRLDPAVQLRDYEFQNPAWFYGRSVVSRNMSLLDNSIFGFKILAGTKIRLLPHQMNTIIRCVQESPCRFMLADEVGMGKTIEALSVLKIYFQEHANASALVVVPATLKEQWKTELLLKFDIASDAKKDGNTVSVKSFDELAASNLTKKNWDFLVVDEVHGCLKNGALYKAIHTLSRRAHNVLLLSATPVQQRKEEYLELLRLLQPTKYDDYDLGRFEELMQKQGRVVQKTALLLDDLDDFVEEVNRIKAEGNNPHSFEECEEMFHELREELEDICEPLQDRILNKLLDDTRFYDADCGISQIKVIASYICANYQVESCVIRNRRRVLEKDDSGNSVLPKRELIEISYDLDEDQNPSEAVCYQLLTDWLYSQEQTSPSGIDRKQLLSAFFSSPWAFQAALQELRRKGLAPGDELLIHAGKWVKEGNFFLENAKAIIDDPFTFEDETFSRIFAVINEIYENTHDKKVVLFTDFEETFNAYDKALRAVFGEDSVSSFGANMDQSDIELQAYSFQTNPACRIMLCDKTGGEGRNFQCADYAVHIDLPWDASKIEQRIGRLDRLERSRGRRVVTSIVVYTANSFEAALFDFWNRGLQIFTSSLSGMEIIMGDIDGEIEQAVETDYRFGLFDKIPKIIELAETMRETVRKEQNYDAAALMYRPLFVDLKRAVENFTKNEDKLFADSMTRWASLAGFQGWKKSEDVFCYDESSFSQASAENSQLIPPRWEKYLESSQSQFMAKVQDAYDQKRGLRNQRRVIEGTFIRDIALTNDYLHFFAPGDPIFDCIVDNAVNSCKGTCSAFSAASRLRWKGLIFTWTVGADMCSLLDSGASPYSLGPYRSYLASAQIIIPIGIDNPENYSDSDVRREYVRLINDGLRKQSVKHLGRRGKEGDVVPGVANIDWFRGAFPEEQWALFVTRARELARKRAIAAIKPDAAKKIQKAGEEMERVLSAQIAKCMLFDEDFSKVKKMKQEQVEVLKILARPKLTLDSVAFVWMER